MFCPKCGKQVDESDAFCRSCGHTLSKEKPASTGVAPASGGAGPVGVGKPQEPTKQSKRLKALAVIGAIIILLAILATVLPNSGERLLRQQEAQTDQENDEKLENAHSLEEAYKNLAETSRRLAEMERRRPHDELALRRALNAVYVGLGAIGLMLVALVIARRIRRRTA
jgi:hypothetical protein